MPTDAHVMLRISPGWRSTGWVKSKLMGNSQGTGDYQEAEIEEAELLSASSELVRINGLRKVITTLHELSKTDI